MADAIDIDEFKKRIATGEPMTVLDVRRKKDYEAEPTLIDTARWCDPERLDDWAFALRTDRPVVVYCVKGGMASQSTADRLIEKQFHVRYLEGGLLAWEAAKGKAAFGENATLMDDK